MVVLVAGEAIGRGIGVDVGFEIEIAVAFAVADTAAAAAAVAAPTVVVGVAPVVAGMKRDCSATRGTVEVGGTAMDGPTIEIGGSSRMETFDDHGRNRKMRPLEGLFVADGSTRAVGSSFAGPS